MGGEIANYDGVLAPVQQQVTQAEEALAAHDARRAISTAQAASELATELVTTLQTYRDLRAAIVQGRNDAEKLEAQGYRMESSHQALNEARSALSSAAAALQEAQDATASLDTARQAIEQAIANGTGLAQLRGQNDQRLPEIEARGQEVANLIQEGRKTFDLVDEFAESTWNDIRGNGTEAQKAADEAHELWQSARERNTMETQAFAAARDDLDVAEKLLNQATELIAAITKRLKDLEAARDAARDELATAAADIARGWEFVRSNDPDVGKQPEQRLHQAEQLLQAAQAEASKEQPDWLALVRQAQAANTEADAALADARSEVEAMEKLRGQVQRAQQVATGEVQKTLEFFSTHAGDMKPANQHALDSLQQEVQAAYALLQQTNAVEEDARRVALEQTLQRYTQLEKNADKVFDTIYADFKRVDQLREQVAQDRTRARNAVNDALRTAQAYGGVVPSYAEPLQLLEGANDNLRRLPARIEGEDNLRAALETLKSVRDDARQADKLIKQNYSLPQQNSGGDFATGVLIGALIDSALDNDGRGHHRRHGGGVWGGSSSGSSSGGGGSWGSGGGGGGSWGGGGGGGGSWGGGGGGGGSWGSGGGGGGGW